MVLLRRPVVYFCQRSITVTGQVEAHKAWSEERTVGVQYDVCSTHDMYMPHMHYIDLGASEGKNVLCGMEVNS